MGDDAPRLRWPRLRRLSQSEAGRRRRRLADTGAVKLFGVGSACRRQNFRIHRHYLAQSGSEAYNRRDDRLTLRKASRPDPRRPSAVAVSPFATRARVADDGGEILPPIGDNPLKSPDSKK
jgi:hypothetical protein